MLKAIISFLSVTGAFYESLVGDFIDVPSTLLVFGKANIVFFYCPKALLGVDLLEPVS